MAFVPSPPPKIDDREVILLLASLKCTNRELGYLYQTFQKVRAQDDILAAVGPTECTSLSVATLISSQRHHVEKLLEGVLELGGYHDVVTWPGFIYVLLKFCTLTKLELAQVLFFVIANEMKSWTVHYLTTSQLEEFYEDYEDVDVLSFNTGNIDFTALALAKYNMVEFVQLTYRFSQLINPMIHLQRCLRQSLPDMSFWRDYDRFYATNRLVTLDFFRYQKSSSLLELMSVANKDFEKEATKLQGIPEQDQMVVEKVKPLKDPHLWEIDESLGELTYERKTHIKRKPAMKADLPLPLPGLGPGLGPPGYYPPKRGAVRALNLPPPMPAWFEERCKQNEEPVRGIALGTAAVPEPPPNWQTPIQQSMTPEEAKNIIEGSQKLVEKVYHAGYTQPSGRFQITEDKKAMQRAKELDFVTKNRSRRPRDLPITAVVDRFSVCELMMRPQQKKQYLERIAAQGSLLGAA
jgi:hypothetical protein